MCLHQKKHLTTIRIVIGHEDRKTSNYVSTTKYNLITFLPLFLFQQFKTFGNIFFLLICVIQFIPSLNPYQTNTTIIPLVTILLVAAAKELFEDCSRLIADRRVNRQLIWAYIRDEKETCWNWERVNWAELKVGHLVKVLKNEALPADIVLISSSEPAGMAYIETANLDGETNLKIRQALPSTAWMVDDDTIAALSESYSVLECGPPNSALYGFQGVMKLSHMLKKMKGEQHKNNDKVDFPLGTNQLLPRGCKLQNTDWVYGVIVYTGQFTKLMLNTNHTHTKVSLVEQITNYLMMIQFGFLVFMALFNTVMGKYSIKNSYYYLPYFHNNFHRIHIGLTLLGLIIFYSGLIPISLNITLEMIQLFQAYFIKEDLHLYDEKSDTRAEVRSSNLNSQLGQVRYIISDKTGTLTQNKMCFKMCSVDGVSYGSPKVDKFSDQKILYDLTNNARNSEAIREFLTLLAICHTVIPEKITSSGLERVIYHSSSPDEEALVKCARDFDFIFHTRTPFCVYIKALGKQEKYEILHVLEFTSNRKRMGVIVRCPDQKIKLYIKGADNVILPRLASCSDKNIIHKTTEHLVEFANLGLRTLCMAMCVLTKEQYEQWEPGYCKASIAIEGREKLIEAEAGKIEKNLRLLGASAIEDKLQRGVKKTIKHLLEGGIAFWVVTGDKLETAQNIGHSCGLIDRYMPILVLSEKSVEATMDKIKMFLNEFSGSKVKISLIVSGESLGHALQKHCKLLFLHLASLCSTVICCRCSPMQKAAMVKLLQHWSNGAVLAIGDGANDVAMIQAADIGVGISGEEGMQASLAADYSIAQFRFLKRLVFVHGAINYHRVTKTILYFFYKNVVHAVTMFLYGFHTLFADTAIIDTWSVVMFNIFFTSWPPLAMGIWDRLLPFSLMMSHPALYRLSQRSEGFSLKMYFVWTITGLVHASVIYFVAYYTFKNDVMWRTGRVADYRIVGTAINIAVVTVVNLKAIIESDSITVMSWIALFGSTIMLFIYLFSYSLTSPASPIIRLETSMADTILHVISSPTILAYIVFVVLVSLSFDLLVKIFQRSLYRTIRDEVVSQVFDVKQFHDLYYPLIKVKKIVVKASESALNLINLQTKQRGYAFSQEESTAVSQSDVVRLYDSREPKTPGSSLKYGSLHFSENSENFSKRKGDVKANEMDDEIDKSE